jgi:NAD+-dependent protein deacetylase sirtuin 6
MDFSQAQPTLTHRAIVFLVEQLVVHFCITQNVDGLHQRSGLSRSKLAVLHGCVFTERCEDCGTEHFGDADVGGMSFQRTGRKCQAEHCQGYLRDTLLDWKDPLPVDDLERCEKECDEADLVLCLGTSLRIEPAASLSTRAKKFVIVNLQCTPYDDQASLIIRAKVDDVMENLLCDLGFPNWQGGGAEWTPRPIERQWRNPASGEYASTWWKKGAQSDGESEDQDESN